MIKPILFKHLYHKSIYKYLHMRMVIDILLFGGDFYDGDRKKDTTIKYTMVYRRNVRTQGLTAKGFLWR